MTPEGKELLRRLCPHEPACRTHVDLVSGLEEAARADTGEPARLREALIRDLAEFTAAGFPSALAAVDAADDLPRRARALAAIRGTEEKE